MFDKKIFRTRSNWTVNFRPKLISKIIFYNKLFNKNLFHMNVFDKIFYNYLTKKFDKIFNIGPK